MKYRLFQHQVLLIPENWFDDCIVSIFNEVADCEFVPGEGDKKLYYVAVDSLEQWHLLNAEVQLYIRDHLEEILDKIDIDYEEFLNQLEFNDLLTIEEATND